VIGLAWGLLVAFLDGLPLLLQGSLLPHIGPRLLSLAYLAAIYGLLFAAAGLFLGGAGWVAFRLVGRPGTRAGLAGLVSGLLAAAAVLLFGLQRYEPETAGWLLILVLSGALGLVAGWLTRSTARSRALSWRGLQVAVLAAYLAAVLAVLLVAGYRTTLRDLPLFNPPATDQVATPQQPNIVLVTAAGLRPDHLGAYGYDPSISPSIDALAQRGLRFDQALAQASWTQPSLASLVTSLYPSQLGITCQAAISCQPHLDEQRATLAETLEEAGYHTAAYLSSPWLTAELGFDQGFEAFETTRAEQPFDQGPTRERALGWLVGCPENTAACRLLTSGHERLFDPPLPQDWGGDSINSRVNRFLEHHDGERFFLWVHYSEALPPYNLEPPFRPLPEGPLASPEAMLKGMGYWRLGDAFAPREKLMPLDVDGLAALYDGEVHRLDRLVGGLAGQLEARGLTEQTLVVVTSDHGQEFMEHGLYTYGHTLHQEVLRVPLIMAGPGIAAPSVIDTPVALLDLAPTLIETAGASLPPEAEGQSLVPVLAGEPLAGRPIYSESLYRAPQELKAVQRDGYKLILNPTNGVSWLYNLEADPSEQEDVSDQQPQVLESMTSELLDWLEYMSESFRRLPRSSPPAEYENAVW
jgi:arylsulfatase A-like enzyme